MIAAVTSFKVKSLATLIPFMRHAIRSSKQVSSANGVLFFQTKARSWHTHMTLSVWEDEEAMRKFMTSGAHLEAMRSSKRLAKETLSNHWEVEKVPDWTLALEMLSKKRRH